MGPEGTDSVPPEGRLRVVSPEPPCPGTRVTAGTVRPGCRERHLAARRQDLKQSAGGVLTCRSRDGQRAGRSFPGVARAAGGLPGPHVTPTNANDEPTGASHAKRLILC